ncbi:MAG TPA: fibronectin type III domain-containing protein, partial [Salinimicrobium sp.]|nr:fibronectin type III domain-containing protein [Salinimicrobium sp.]
MKKFTLLIALLLTFVWQGQAQYGCESAVVISDGYTVTGVTSPGTGGAEDWNENPSGTSINSSYWDDDVYLFEYTSGATAETISISIFTRNNWNGVGIFDDCTGTTFSNELAASGSSSASDFTHTLSATIPAGNTVYIAIGQWGTPNGVDFDVTDFSVTAITCPAPSELTATNISTTTADLGWTALGSETMWNIEVADAGMATGTATATGVSNPYNATGLTANTPYEFYIQADCGGGDESAWVGPFAFTTPCAAFDLPVSENFDGTSTGTSTSPTVPDCWTFIDGG